MGAVEIAGIHRMSDGQRRASERRKAERRLRERRACSLYFEGVREAAGPTPSEQASMDTAIWCKYLQDIPLTPLEAMRLPRLVPQPKEWVREIWDEVRNGEG